MFNREPGDNKNREMPLRSSGFRGKRYLATVLGILALVLGVLTVYAALPAPTFPLVPSGGITPDVWEPDASPSWVNGQPNGWSEGETAAVSAYISPASVTIGATYQAYLCIEIVNDSPAPPPDLYAFSGFGAWDDTLTPPVLSVTDDATPPYSDTNWDTGDAIVYGYNIDIIAVAGPEKGTGVGSDCATNYEGVLVTFKLTNASNDGVGIDGAWIVYGGLLAEPGATLPTGFPSSTVPAGSGASSINGTFQTRIGGSGDKTINLKGSGGVAPATADLKVTKQCPNFTGATTNISSFTVSVENLGPSTAFNLALQDQWQVGFVTANGNYTSKVDGVDAGSCVAATPAVNCTLAELAAGSTWEVTFEASVNSGVAQGTNFTNAAQVSAASPTDPDSTNNTATATCETPVTISYFSSAVENGAVRLDWTTASESGNLGFNIYALTSEGKVLLNDELIPSKAISSRENQDYSVAVTGLDADSFVIENVDVRGFVEQKGPFELGEVFGQRAVPDVINWEAIRTESALKSSTQSVEKPSRQSPFETKGGTAVVTSSSAATAINLTVNEDGLYRVSYEQLRNAGMDLQGVSVKDIAVTSQGISVPVYINSSRSFGNGDYIEFYGEGLDTLYTSGNVYTVLLNAALAKRVAENNQVPARKAIPAGFYMETLVVDDNNMLFDYLSNTEPWINGYLLANNAYTGKDFPFTGVDSYVAGAAPATITADLWGGYDGPHSVFTELNGALLSNRGFRGIVKDTFQKVLPEGALQNGQNTFRITSAVDGRDLIVFDKLSITYPRGFVARGGELSFTGAAEVFSVDNLGSSDVTVYRIADGVIERMMRVKTRDVSGKVNAWFAGAPGAAKYVVADGSAVKTPAAIEPAVAPVNISSGSVNTLIISHPDFIGADLTALAATREAQGKSVKIVDVRQVYAQYSNYVVDPQAIKAYLKHAIDNMGVEMVLLVGADTYDYRNYVSNSISFIPSLYAETGTLIRFAPVDPLYVDSDGNNVPNAVIGRMPVRTSAELKTLLNKTQSYIGKSGYNGTAVFAADASYTADSMRLAGLMPSWSVTRANIGEIGKTSARQALINSINSGVALTTYFGHSAADSWAHEGLFNLADAAALTNVGKPTVVTQYGCWNTYYVSPNSNTLSHKLLLGANGAALVTGATTLTSAVSEAKLGDLMVPALTSGITVGQAMQDSKETLALTDPDRVDVLLGWTILGVPWLEVE